MTLKEFVDGYRAGRRRVWVTAPGAVATGTVTDYRARGPQMPVEDNLAVLLVDRASGPTDDRVREHVVRDLEWVP